MFFQVPSAVMEEIAEYDPVVSKEKKIIRKVKNPRNTFGLVNDLFPENIVPLETQSEWATEMNRRTAHNRYVTHNTDQAYAILYVVSGVWCAYWYAKNTHPDKDKYIFGFSICYKSSEASLKKFGDPCFGWNSQKYPNLSSIVPYTDVKYGKVCMRKHTALVTKENIIEWNMTSIPDYSGVFYMPLSNWTRELFKNKNIKVWGASGYYPDFSRLIAEADVYKFILNNFFRGTKVEDLPSISNLGDLACLKFSNLSKIIRTPFFEREGNKIILELKEKLSTEDDLNQYDATNGIIGYMQACSVVSAFLTIYGDENVDYCQRAWKAAGQHFNFYNHHYNHLSQDYIHQDNKGAFDWMRANLPAASFLNMLERTENNNLQDAIRMMGNLWAHQNKVNPRHPFSIEEMKTPLSLDKPKRWRSSELHDLVNEKLFKIRNPNKSLPQDLFPEPIKVGTYTFFQPTDTHQLAKWGQAVRNCVGNSTYYAELVMKKKEFIVLALDNGQPKFTIQLKVQDSRMEVKQIVGICNKYLTNAEQKKYASSFAKALKIREEQLKKKE